MSDLEQMQDLEELAEMPTPMFVRNLETIGRQVGAPYILEAARRLSRYAPVSLSNKRPDFVDGNWRKEVEVWDSKNWSRCPVAILRRVDLAGTMFTHWRRINNEPPE